MMNGATGTHSGTDVPPASIGTDPHLDGLTVAEAAVSLGVSVNTIRRWIKESRIRSERVTTPTGYAYRVFPDGVPIAGTHAGSGTGSGTRSDTDQQVSGPSTTVALETQRAEAMAVYTRTLLEPLVARLAEQEAIIRDQAEALGRQTERLAGVERDRRVALSRIAELECLLAPEPVPGPSLQSIPPTSNAVPWWRRWWLSLAGAGVVLAMAAFALVAIMLGAAVWVW